MAGIHPNSADNAPLAAGQVLLWLDCADLNTIHTNSPQENVVLYMHDKSPFQRNFGLQDFGAATFPSVVSYPRTGRTALTCTPINGLTADNVPEPMVQFTMFLVFSDNSATGTLFDFGDGDILVNEATVDVSSLSVAAPDEFSDDETHIMMLRWETTSGDVSVKFDDSDEIVLGNTTVNLEDGYTTFDFMNNRVGSDGSQARFGEVIVYSDFLQPLQLNRVGRYLCRKWDLTWSDVAS